MKYHEDLTVKFGSDKAAMRKQVGKGRKLHSFMKDEDTDSEADKARASYKRAQNKNLMRNQLREMQMAY